MKLAEALQERADLNRKIEQLETRMTRNTLVQEGEKPAENINELKKELDDAIARLGRIMTQINLTNATCSVAGRTLTEWIAIKDTLSMKVSAYRQITASASNTTYRARGSEIKIQSTISVSDWQKEIDRLSADLRKVDNLLQETNWKTELIEK